MRIMMKAKIFNMFHPTHTPHLLKVLFKITMVMKKNTLNTYTSPLKIEIVSKHVGIENKNQIIEKFLTLFIFATRNK